MAQDLAGPKTGANEKKIGPKKNSLKINKKVTKRNNPSKYTTQLAQTQVPTNIQGPCEVHLRYLENMPIEHETPDNKVVIKKT